VRVRDAYRPGTRMDSVLDTVNGCTSPCVCWTVQCLSTGQSISVWMKGERSITQTSRKEG